MASCGSICLCTHIFTFAFQLYVLGLQNCLQISTSCNQVWTWVEEQSYSFGAWMQESTFLVVGTLRNNTASWDKLAGKGLLPEDVFNLLAVRKSTSICTMCPCEQRQASTDLQQCLWHSSLFSLSFDRGNDLVMRHYLKSAHSGY